MYNTQDFLTGEEIQFDKLCKCFIFLGKDFPCLCSRVRWRDVTS